MLNTALDSILALARSSLRAQADNLSDADFPKLAEAIDAAVVEELDFAPLVASATVEDVTFGQYLKRVVRTVAAEEDLTAAGQTQRLVLCGAGVLLPPGLSPELRQWREAAAELGKALAARWAESVNSVTVMRQPVALDQLYQLSPTQIRSALLQSFAQGYAEEFAQDYDFQPAKTEWSAFVLPIIVGCKPEFAKTLLTAELAPGPMHPSMAAMKHRFEARFDGLEAAPPQLFPPLSWANVFSVMRVLHFRRMAREVVGATPGGWAASIEPPKVRMTNAKAQRTHEFWFPEESTMDIQSAVAPLAGQLGIDIQTAN